MFFFYYSWQSHIAIIAHIINCLMHGLTKPTPTNSTVFWSSFEIYIYIYIYVPHWNCRCMRICHCHLTAVHNLHCRGEWKQKSHAQPICIRNYMLWVVVIHFDWYTNACVSRSFGCKSSRWLVLRNVINIPQCHTRHSTHTEYTVCSWTICTCKSVRFVCTMTESDLLSLHR